MHLNRNKSDSLVVRTLASFVGGPGESVFVSQRRVTEYFVIHVQFTNHSLLQSKEKITMKPECLRRFTLLGKDE